MYEKIDLFVCLYKKKRQNGWTELSQIFIFNLQV